MDIVSEASLLVLLPRYLRFFITYAVNIVQENIQIVLKYTNSWRNWYEIRGGSGQVERLILKLFHVHFPRYVYDYHCRAFNKSLCTANPFVFPPLKMILEPTITIILFSCPELPIFQKNFQEFVLQFFLYIFNFLNCTKYF